MAHGRVGRRVVLALRRERGKYVGHFKERSKHRILPQIARYAPRAGR
ncbi:hypothetical protein SDC9_130063 [bioreactor metagenome]|uniref:Uncharacterized protein n=1 Tax=bioreactor metagenome TaxID=1076179 RepID=A0A645D0H1_9ZZZZ